MFIRKSLLQLEKFASSDAKRLLQHNRPVSAASVVCGAAAFGGLSAAPTTGRGRQFMTHNGISPPSIAAARQVYSITSSAPTGSDCGMVRPRALAILRLMTSSNFVGIWTGRSAGFPAIRKEICVLWPFRSAPRAPCAASLLRCSNSCRGIADIRCRPSNRRDGKSRSRVASRSLPCTPESFLITIEFDDRMFERCKCPTLLNSYPANILSKSRMGNAS